jgi:hypothetical protein
VVIAGVYLGVTSGLDAGVREQQLDRLARTGRQYNGPIWDALNRALDHKVLDRRVRKAGDDSGTRVTLLGVSHGTLGPQTYIASDSTAETKITDLQFEVALDATRTGRVARGTEAGATGRVAEAALPVRLTPPRGSKRADVSYVVVFSSPL